VAGSKGHLGSGFHPLPDLGLDGADAFHIGVGAALCLTVEERFAVGIDLEAAGANRDYGYRGAFTEVVPDFGRHPGGQGQVPSLYAVSDLDGEVAGIPLHHSGWNAHQRPRMLIEA